MSNTNPAIGNTAAPTGVDAPHDDRKLAQELADYYAIFTKSSHLFRDGRPLHEVTRELLSRIALTEATTGGWEPDEVFDWQTNPRKVKSLRRVPTAEMVEAGRKAMEPEKFVSHARTVWVWLAMHDAAPASQETPLSAAATELLEALQELVRIRDWAALAGGCDGPLPQDVITKFAEQQIPAIDAARAAIAKATGEQA